MSKQYKLLDAQGNEFLSDTKGLLGGHKGTKIYGRMDCPAALRALKNGGYVKFRVFFADEKTAIAAGFRPCGACMRERYKQWKADPENFK